MTFLYNIFIQPIYMIIQVVFILIWRLFKQSWCAIIGVSLAVCFLTAPIYKQADLLQEKERNKQKEMKPWIDRIKKYFSGDERFMMLSTYYRQVDYRPVYALRQSLSLLLQIPFFMAAYSYLSNLRMLVGEPFGPINDLSMPDRLIQVGTISINVLPIAMTLISIISGIIYTRGFSKREKIQTFVLPVIFLVLLYNSPAGLVLYWTTNNIFSFFRIIFTKVIKIPKKAVVLAMSCGIPTACLLVYLSGFSNNMRKTVFLIVVSVLSLLPLMLDILKKRGVLSDSSTDKESERKNPELRKIFALSCLLLFIIMGLLVPSSVIVSSPEEFIDLRAGNNPLSFIMYTAEVYCGSFLVWGGVMLWMLSSFRIRKKLAFGTWAVGIACLVDFLFFGRNLGTLYKNLSFVNEIVQSTGEKIINILVLSILFVLLFFVFEKKRQSVKVLSTVLCIAVGILAGVNISKIVTILNKSELLSENSSKTPSEELEGIIPLSKKGKNVVVIMVDAAINGYVPYIFNEKPELEDSFSGFEYYPNTTTLGIGTICGAPGLFGGYKYTPRYMNERKDELLKDKVDEALKVLPATMSAEGYHVTVCDPPYAGFSMVPDISIYDDLENVDSYLLEGVYEDTENPDYGLSDLYNMYFVGYSLFKVAPVVTQKVIYDEGYYYTDPIKEGDLGVIRNSFMVMSNLNYFTHVADDNTNNLLILSSCITHEPQILQLPDYELKEKIDNRGLETGVRSDGKGNTIEFKTKDQMKHYHANVAAFMKLAKWFDYLRENGVYDNTRIIVVSDHGRAVGIFGDEFPEEMDLSLANALLMVKDFDQKGNIVTTNMDFMTNADTPSLVMKGLIDNPVNPYTGNSIDNSDKINNDQYVVILDGFDLHEDENSKVFDPKVWYSVHDDIFEKDNWEKLGSRPPIN